MKPLGYKSQETMWLKRHAYTGEVIPQDIVELILERLPVKSLLRFKSVSRTWKSLIESRSFQQRHLLCRKLSRGPDVLFVLLASLYPVDSVDQRFEFGTSVAYTVRLPATSTILCHGSCDGVVCLHRIYSGSMNVVSNPATRWHCSFPASNVQQYFAHEIAHKSSCTEVSYLGFGKDKFRGTYKPVWLYNSSDFGLENITTCEVFDFSTNAWRYVVPASPYRILKFHKPVHLDGSLHWFTEDKETKIVSFDLHTETFQVISNAPFPHAPDPRDVAMCILDNRLCASHKIWPSQVIWSLDSSSGSWKELCSIDLSKSFERQPNFPLSPIAIVDTNKLLLKGRQGLDPVIIHDMETKSCDLLFKPVNPVAPVFDFESLFSVLSE